MDQLLERIATALETIAGRLPEGPLAGDAEAVRPALAFHWTKRGPRPIAHPDLIDPASLVGVDDALAQLRANTARFVAGKPANDVLVWGDRGTGKSSLVKAMLTLFHGAGLRMIWLDREAFDSLPDVGDWVGARNERFIVYFDDLSFGEGETQYRSLKSLLEGGLTARPDNLLVYATSNRRHLVPEYRRENDPAGRDGEIHPRESVEEKIALSDRFGLRIGFYAPDQETYLRMVDAWLAHYGVEGDRGQLHREAIRFALKSGQRSGRAAHQFVRSLDR